MARHWDPIRDLMLLQDRMNQLFEDATQRRTRARSETSDEMERADWTPVADIYEQPEQYVVAVDAPGIDRAALEIDFENERLVIKGTKATVNGEQTRHRTERPHGKFNRSFSVPSSVDPAKIEAEYKDGVLYVRLPKRAEEKAGSVKIKIS
jgi:HSP20 family protein